MGGKELIQLSRKEMSSFIELYRQYPCLWDISCTGYKDKNARDAALEKLTNLVKQWYPEATKDMIARKILSFRSCHRRERKKVIMSERITPEEPYKPELWYYHLLSFLGVKGESKKKLREIAEDEPDCYEYYETSGEDQQDQDDDFDDPTELQLPNETKVKIETITESVREGSSDRIKPMNIEHDPLITNERKRLRTEINDEYDAIGFNVATKLRNLAPNQRIIAEKLINDILFQAQINGLTNTSVVKN